MKNKKLTLISFNELSESSDLFAIKNFILSETEKDLKNMSFNYPYAFDGIILSICVRGSATFRINYTNYTTTPNSIVIILPGQIFEIIEQSKDLLIVTLIFSFEFFINAPLPTDLDILDNINQSPCLKITKEETNSILELHNIVIKEFRLNKIYKEEIIRSVLVSIIINVSELYTSSKTNNNSLSKTRYEDIKDQFIKLLITHHKQERNPVFYADKIFVSPKHLSGVLKEVTGRSIKNWIDESVILEAKMLIKATDMTVLQISEELNFPNPSFFGKYFKKHTGMTPLEYKKS